jgi:hypothetical protein
LKSFRFNLPVPVVGAGGKKLNSSIHLLWKQQ